ncbi:transcription factor bHLH95-like [Panicum virgatum]|uniref:transcription factor bHLH95-like n=1 Tax=Panicum virgatum TaxID=38727 RepID=UPI0019D500C5|nr:transcription factor bHLH95-like [Panicum virgatum]
MLGRTAVIHADEGNNTVSKQVIQAAIHAGEGNNAVSKLAIQSVPHADEDNNSLSKLARLEVLNAGDDDDDTAASKFAIQAPPHAGEDKLANPAAVGNEGKSDVVGGEGGESAAATGSSGDGALSKTSKKSTSDDGGGSEDAVVKDGPAAVADDGGTRGRKGKGKGAAAAKKDQALHIWTEKERRKKMKNMFSTLHALLPQLPEKADKSTIVGEAVTYIKSLEGTVQRLEKLKQERMLAQQAAVGAGSSSGAASSSAPPPPAAAAQAVAATRESVLADMVQRWNAQEALVAELKAAATAVVYGAGTASDGAVPAPAPPLPPVPPRAPPLQTWSARNIVVCVAGDSAFINLCTPRHPGMLTRLFYVLERHQIHVVAATVSSSPTEKMFFIQARINTAVPPPPMLPENMTVEERYKLAVAEMLHAVGGN